MTVREDPELVAKAQAKAEAGITALRAQRIAEGATEADLDMFQSLASTVLWDRLANDNMVGTTSKGRIIIEPGERTPAITHWFTNVVKPLTEPTIDGGPHQEGAQS